MGSERLSDPEEVGIGSLRVHVHRVDWAPTLPSFWHPFRLSGLGGRGAKLLGVQKLYGAAEGMGIKVIVETDWEDVRG